jgi:hypothetical protein
VLAADTETPNDVTLGLRVADDSIGTVHGPSEYSENLAQECLGGLWAGGAFQAGNLHRPRAFACLCSSSGTKRKQDEWKRDYPRSYMGANRQVGAPPVPCEELIKHPRVTLDPDRVARF